MAAISAALLRAEWQPSLFGDLSRARLAQCDCTWPLATIRVRVHRNHAIEPVTSVATPFAAWNGLAFAWSLGPYDDSLSFTLDEEADVEAIWLDTGRLTGLPEGRIGPWLLSRLQALRARNTNPIVVLAWPLAQADRSFVEQAALPGIYLADLDPLAASWGARWLDLRAESLSGTRLSNHACMAVARELACRWLPACIRPPVKCVVLDLDDTLYAGVLGEDGADGVTLTDDHRALQEYLVTLAGSGVLLAVVSHNDRDDVEALFACRHDFPLRPRHLSVIEASWEDKTVALARVAERLRIGTDAMVVVDDNPGELASFAAASDVVTVQARTEREGTRNALSHVAGLWRWRAFGEDALRAGDLAAAGARERIARAQGSPEDYFRELEVRLRYYIGMQETVARIAALAGKTNQFNLSLRRSSEAEIAARLAQHPGNVIAIGLADRLSDSGVVGLLVGNRDGETLRVEELSVSCRALGRRIENDMLTKALCLMARRRGIARVCFDVARGARNAPARDWLAGYAGVGVLPDTTSIFMPLEAILAKPVSDAIEVRVDAAETVE